MGVTPPGTILVPIKIVPDPEKKESRPVQPIGAGQTILPTDVDAGYLVGPPDRIGEMFHLLGISSPYSISMDLKHFGHDLFLQGRTGFLTTNRLPVGPDYMLGPGDEVKVRVWGKVEGAWNLDDRPGRHGADAEGRRRRAGGTDLRAGPGGAAEGVFQVLQRVRDERHPRGAADDDRLRRGQRAAAGGLHGFLPRDAGQRPDPGRGTDQVRIDEGHPDPPGGEGGRALRHVRLPAAGGQIRRTSASCRRT